jgi:hypothetical protein
MTDDWGKPLGADEAKTMTANMTTQTKNTIVALVYHFNKSIDYSMNREVNALALSKTFKTLRDSGTSYNELHSMIDRFFYEIKRKPLPHDVLLWTAFIKRKDELLTWVTKNSINGDVSEWK